MTTSSPIGASLTFTSTTPLSSQSPGSSGAGIYYTIPASLDPSYGTSVSSSIGSIPVSAAVSFKAGITGSLAATLGQFTPNIQVNVSETAPTSVTLGQVFAVTPTLVGSGDESFSMVGPGLTANLDLGITGSAGFFINKGALIEPTFAINPSFSIAAKLPTTHAFQLPDNIGSVIIAEPMPFTTTGMAGTTVGSLPTLSASGTDTSSAPNNEVLGGTLNFAGVVQAVADVPLSNSFSAGVATLSYSLLSVPLNIGLGINQSMTLTPLGISDSVSEMEGGQQIGATQTGSLGQTFDFTAPTVNNGPITIDNTYSLNLGVSTSTGLTGVISLNIVGPVVSASAFGGFLGGSIGPLFDASIFNLSTGLGTIATENFDDTLTTTSSLDIPIVCYLRGTRIATERGEVAVEHLTTDDRVRTASGDLRPVRWIGHRRIDCRRHPDPKSVWPIRIQAHAFGDGEPFRDLWVSPGHAVLVNEVLIQAYNLANGSTIAWVPRDQVEYWHVQLDDHDVLLAEGLPAESYLDTGNRAFFLSRTRLDLIADSKPKHWTETCVPLVTDGPLIESARRTLLERAQTLGHELTDDADVHVLADGVRVEPVALSANRVGFALPAGASSLTLKSRTFVPYHIDPASQDDRALGIAVVGLQVDGTVVSLDDPAAFGEGWHTLQQAADGTRYRWSTDLMPLPPGARFVFVDFWKPRRDYWKTGTAPSVARLAV